MIHSRSNSQCPDDSSSYSLQQDHSPTEHIYENPLPNRNSATTMRDVRNVRNSINRRTRSAIPASYQRKWQANVTTNYQDPDLANPLLDFILSRKSETPSSVDKKINGEQVWWEDDRNDLRNLFHTEDSKESTPMRVSWEQERARLQEDVETLAQELKTQAEAHELIIQKFRQRNYALETARQNLDHTILRMRTNQEHLQQKLSDMHEEKHHLQVQLVELNMWKPKISTGILSYAQAQSAMNAHEDSWEPSIQIVQEDDCIPREEFNKIMREHKKELREKTSWINRLEMDLKEFIAKNKELISSTLNLKDAKDKLTADLKNTVGELEMNSDKILHMNNKLELAYEQITELKDQHKTDEMEMKRLSAQIKRLQNQKRTFRESGGTNNTRTSLQRLRDEVVVINNDDNASQEAKTRECSDRTAKDDDSIKSNYGSFTERLDNIEVNGLSPYSEHNLSNLWVEFAQRNSFEAKQDECSRSSLRSRSSFKSTSTRSDYEVPKLASRIKTGSTMPEMIREEMPIFGLGGLRNNHHEALQDTNFQVKYTIRKGESASKPISFWGALRDWKWVIPSSLIFMTMLIYMIKSSKTISRRYPTRRRRAVS